MPTRVALLSIIVEDPKSVNMVNELLHQYRNYLIGRMGLPYPKKKISIISVALDTSADIINALCGKLGSVPGINSKVIYSNH